MNSKWNIYLQNFIQIFPRGKLHPIKNNLVFYSGSKHVMI